MGDVISAGDRALIDAHIARRGVTRVERGVSGLLEFDTPAPWSKAWRARRAATVSGRRDKVHMRITRGETHRSIARTLGVSQATIADDVAALKAAGRLPADLRRTGGAKYV